MTDKQMSMYGFLCKHQETGASFTLEDLADYAGYKDAAMETIASRNLRDVWLHEVGDGRYVVRDFVDVTPKAFAAYVCQTTRSRFEDQGCWRNQLAKLLAHGLQQGFPVYEAIEQTLEQITSPSTETNG